MKNAFYGKWAFLVAVSSFLTVSAARAHSNQPHSVRPRIKQGALCISFVTLDSFKYRAEYRSYQAFSRMTCGLYPNRVIITHPERMKDATKLTAEESARVQKLLDSVDRVDLFIYGHTNHAADHMPALLAGSKRAKVRLVYNSGCDDGTDAQAREWLKVADTFVGHPKTNYGPQYTPIFMAGWFYGATALNANAAANFTLKQVRYYFKNGNNPYGYVWGDPNVTITSN